MDPLSLFLAFVVISAASDRRAEVSTKRGAILGDRYVLPEVDAPLFDIAVRHYRETGVSSGIDFIDLMYAEARERRIPTEAVSKVMTLLRNLIREDRISWREFRSVPQAGRHHWIKTATGHDVHLARLVYVDVAGLYQREGRAGITRYESMRDYVDRCLPIELQFEEATGEFWAWIPTPDNRHYATGLRQWNTIIRKWPDFVDPEVASCSFQKRPPMSRR